jgi:uncharacterized membrane protein YdjX (TVP38/TMEM64 family)
VKRRQLVLLLVVVLVVAAYFIGGGDKLLNPALYRAWYQQSPFLTGAVFFLVFLLGTALSLPVSGVLSVVSGIIFGHLVGGPLALLAGATGGSLALLVSRYLFRNLVQQRFAVQLAVINKGVDREGAFYLFCLRMVPVVPFWLLNLLMGATHMSVPRFFVATLLGMLPVTLILVNFGAQLGAVESFSMADLFTPGLLLSLTLLAMLPIIARGVVVLIRRRVMD